MTVKFTNNASSTVATAINTTATSLVVASAAGFPTLSGSGDYCYLTIQQAAGTVREVVKATALSTNTFTIVRAQDGTSAASWSTSDVVELRVTAALLTDVIDAATHDSSVLSVDSTNNRVGVNDITPAVTLDINGTDAIALPVGTTAQRPSAGAGRFRYNSSLSQFEGYTDAWGAIGGGGTNTFTHDAFSCNGSTTAFALSQTTGSENNLIVFIDGVFQEQGAYSIATASGTTTLTLSAAPASGRKLVVYSVAAGISGANLNLDSMTGDGSDVTLTLSLAPVTEQNTQVFIDGVYQNKSTYSTSGTTLTFSTAPPTGSAVEVVTMTQTEINVPVDGTITSAKLSGALTTPSTLVATGKITADAGIDIDNINIDGTTIALSSGDLTLDVAGNITLDADGGDVFFKDGGTTFGTILKSTNDLRIRSVISDGNLVLQGNDNGSIIAALTLDMSAAGSATFNSTVTAATLVSANGVLELDDNGSHNGIVNSPASLLINIDSDNSATNENFIVAKDRTGTTGGTELFRINEAGKVLIGTATNTTGDAIQIESPASGGGYGIQIRRNDNNTDQQIGQIKFGNAVDEDLGQISVKTDGANNSGAILFSTASAGTTSERFRLDKNGGVGIGTASVSTWTKLQVVGTAGAQTGATQALYLHSPSTTANEGTGIRMSAASGSHEAVGIIGVVNNASGNSGAMTFHTYNGGANLPEVMRITSDGDFHVGTGGNNPGASQKGFAYRGAAGNYGFIATGVVGTNGLTHHAFYNPNGFVGQIYTTGSSVVYATSSDHRLKENVVVMSGATERLKQLKPSRFNFIADADTTVDGFLAHEVQAVVPEAISGTKDAVDADGNPEYQGIDQSKLVPLLVATIQELEARLTALEA